MLYKNMYTIQLPKSTLNFPNFSSVASSRYRFFIANKLQILSSVILSCFAWNKIRAKSEPKNGKAIKMLGNFLTEMKVFQHHHHRPTRTNAGKTREKII